MKSDKKDIYTEVTDKIIEAIEAGTAPWQRPWRDGQISSAYHEVTENIKKCQRSYFFKH